MGGKIFFLVLVVVALAVIAGLIFRPATVIGVSEDSLAYSIKRQVEGSSTGKCLEGDDRYVCTALTGTSPYSRSAYEVTTDDYGCWDAALRGDGKQPPETLEGCISIIDLVRSGD